MSLVQSAKLNGLDPQPAFLSLLLLQPRSPSRRRAVLAYRGAVYCRV